MLLCSVSCSSVLFFSGYRFLIFYFLFLDFWLLIQHALSWLSLLYSGNALVYEAVSPLAFLSLRLFFRDRRHFRRGVGLTVKGNRLLSKYESHCIEFCPFHSWIAKKIPNCKYSRQLKRQVFTTKLYFYFLIEFPVLDPHPWISVGVLWSAPSGVCSKMDFSLRWLYFAVVNEVKNTDPLDSVF